jgi:hypothetical protein
MVLRPMRTYQRKFQKGINTWIADNLKGKSTIFKIIKYCLTGDNTIKRAIKDWFKDFLLEFSLASDTYTVHIDASASRVKCALYKFTIEEFTKLKGEDKLNLINPNTIFTVASEKEFTDKIEDFFFHELSFYTLQYRHRPGLKNESVEANLSWQTYFKSIYLELTKLGDSRDTATVLGVLGDYLKRSQVGIAHFVTGYITGDEVLNSLKKKIATLLPDLDIEKQRIFFDVLAHVIRYAYHSHWGYDKSKFLFLFSRNVTGGIGADAKEGHLQDSLFESLKHTSMAQYFEYEKGKVASGGRVDIIFQCDKMRIPIEVKKTDESPTLEGIEKYYIAQAQTYASAYDQLGVFVLLDLSDKEKNPIPNFKDWFNLHHLLPATSLPVNHPDYVVSVVIPGNKLLPSMMSTYK